MINIIQVGYGYWGANVAKNIMASKMINLQAICDISEQSLDKAKVLYTNNVEYSIDYRSYLTKSEIDAFAIVIQTEPSFEIALDVLNAGKHLFIEKPMAINADRASEICKLAKKKDLLFIVII